MTVNGANFKIFAGFEGAPGTCQGEPDTTPGTNMGAVVSPLCHHGGGMNSATIWSPSSGANVPTPNRYPQVAANWNQKWVRHTYVASGEGGNPGPAKTSADVIDAVNECVASGMIAVIETHEFTGTVNGSVPFAWNAPTPAPGGYLSWADQLVFWDTIVQAFNGNPMVWFNFFNEPDGSFAAGPTAWWQAQANFWIRRTRDFHQANNMIVMDIASYGQELQSVAVGQYDTWWANLGALNSEVVLGWHAYGARQLNGGAVGYTYALMDQDIAAVKARGFPLMVGEYGQSAQIGTGNAGPDQWNRNATEYLVSTIHGQPLAQKHGLMFAVWHATGDAAFWHQYKLTLGDNPGGPDGNLDPGADGWSLPFWHVNAGNHATYCEPLGVWHGQASGAW